MKEPSAYGNDNGDVNRGGKRLNGLLLNGSQQCASLRNQEIVKLERELRKAYVQKDLHAQLIEQQANRQAEEIQQRIADEVNQCRAEAESMACEKLETSKRKSRMAQVQAVLQHQIKERLDERRIREEQESLYRRALVSADKLREMREKSEKIRTKLELEKQMQLERLIHCEMQEIKEQKYAEADHLKSIKDEIYVQSIKARECQLKKLREEAQKMRREATEAVAILLLELPNDREEQKRKLVEIMSREVIYDMKIEAKEAEMWLLQKKKDLAKDLEEQIRFEEECKRRFLVREKKFADDIMAKVMESEKMEQLSAEAQRQRKIEYRGELERLMSERERIREEELTALRNYFNMKYLFEEIEHEHARKERLALLRQHLHTVTKYIDRSALYDEERKVLDESMSAQRNLRD